MSVGTSRVQLDDWLELLFVQSPVGLGIMIPRPTGDCTKSNSSQSSSCTLEVPTDMDTQAYTHRADGESIVLRRPLANSDCEHEATSIRRPCAVRRPGV